MWSTRASTKKCAVCLCLPLCVCGVVWCVCLCVHRDSSHPTPRHAGRKPRHATAAAEDRQTHSKLLLLLLVLGPGCAGFSHPPLSQAPFLLACRLATCCDLSDERVGGLRVVRGAWAGAFCVDAAGGWCVSSTAWRRAGYTPLQDLQSAEEAVGHAHAPNRLRG